MGNTNNKEKHLSKEMEQQVIDTFKMFDKNNSNNIDKEETLSHW